MNVVTIIQARMLSTRLPGKVLLPINKKPVLDYVVQRARKAKTVNKVIVATSTNRSDNPIVQYCKAAGVDYYRGELLDVLSRYYHAAKNEKADIVIRVTADCPLIDGTLIDKGFIEYRRSKPDYYSNTVQRTFPRGFDFEIFSFAVLEDTYRNAKEPYEREHVTPYIWFNNSNKFRIQQMTQSVDTSRYRITIDTQDDYLAVKSLIEKFNAHEKDHREITEILDNHPEIVSLNQYVQQKPPIEYEANEVSSGKK